MMMTRDEANRIVFDTIYKGDIDGPRLVDCLFALGLLKSAEPLADPVERFALEMDASEREVKEALLATGLKLVEP
jgi:hypothetical protein